MQEQSTTQRTVAILAAAGILCLALASSPGSASTIAASSTASFAGNYGIEINIDTTCAASDDLALGPQTISTPQLFEACQTITATGVVVASPGDVTLRAGSSVALEDGVSVGDGAQLSVIVDENLETDAYVQDSTPAAEPRYRLRFHLRADQLTLSPFEDFDHFGAYSNAEVAQFRLVIRDSAGQTGLALVARLDNGTEVETPVGQETLVSAGWHHLELDWMASAAGAANGHLKLWLDDQAVAELSNLDNDLARVDLVRWGMVEGFHQAPLGVLYVDEFVSRRSGYIGPLP